LQIHRVLPARIEPWKMKYRSTAASLYNRKFFNKVLEHYLWKPAVPYRVRILPIWKWTLVRTTTWIGFHNGVMAFRIWLEVAQFQDQVRAMCAFYHLTRSFSRSTRINLARRSRLTLFPGLVKMAWKKVPPSKFCTRQVTWSIAWSKEEKFDLNPWWYVWLVGFEFEF
jgi:hypothetical protein